MDRKSALTRNQKTLVDGMAQLGFGTYQMLTIRDGQPVFDPPPIVLRELKLGGENGPRPEAGLRDFELKRQVVDLFEVLARVKSGTVHQLVVKHGIPFSLVLEETPASGGPAARDV